MRRHNLHQNSMLPASEAANELVEALRLRLPEQIRRNELRRFCNFMLPVIPVFFGGTPAQRKTSGLSRVPNTPALLIWVITISQKIANDCIATNCKTTQRPNCKGPRKKWDTRKLRSHEICVVGGLPKVTDDLEKRLPCTGWRRNDSNGETQRSPPPNWLG